MTSRPRSFFAVFVPMMALLAACGSGADNAAPANCSSGQTWSDGDHGSPLMHPGGNCIDCHSSGEGPRFAVAGTVMKASNDDENCDGVSGVSVVITGADGQKISLTTNGAGNFYSNSAVATPYKVTLTANGKTRSMAASQTDLNCMNCHTAEGANGAPGRILVP
jgi:mono/diheme cytochrome c family protein